MKHIKRFSALVLALVMVASLAVVPAHAEQYVSRSNFWQWIAGETGGIYQKIVGNITGDAVCPDSQDGKHHASSYVYDSDNGHYQCICDYCGETFTATATNMQDAYTDYVDNLPVNGIDNNGGFLWYPRIGDLVLGSNTSLVVPRNSQFLLSEIPFEGEHTQEAALIYISDNNDGIGVDVYPKSGYNHFYTTQTRSAAQLYYNVPLSGSYQVLSGYSGIEAVAGCTDNSDYYYSCLYSEGSVYHKNLGERLWTSVGTETQTAPANIRSLHIKYYFPVIRVTPDSTNGFDSIYTVDSRPSTYNGKYLVQNGDAYEDSSTTIIDESTSSVYNPVTGDTTTYDSWIYDYSTRTYTMTDNTNNSTTTVTYGDENITINEGGNTYNIYYGTVVNNGDSGGGGSGGGDDSGDGGILSRLGELLGTLVNGLLGGITSFVSAIFDGLIALANVISEKFGQVVEAVLGWFAEIPALFSGFTEFLSAVFVYIPADLMLLLSFGLAAVVFIAIIKALRR